MVHECFVKLVEASSLKEAQNRRHFFSIAAKVMQQIQIDRYRQKKAEKRGGDKKRVTEDLLDQQSAPDEMDAEALHVALDQLESNDPRQHEIVMLRFFAGLSMSDIAECLKLSLSTIEKEWRFARSWLHEQLA